MSGHFCSQWPRYLWSGFGFPFFLMLFAVVSPKCNRPSVTLVTWSVRRSILKQTTEMSREWNRAQRLGTSGLLEPSVGFVPCSHTPQKPHTLEFLTSQHGCTKEGHRTTPWLSEAMYTSGFRPKDHELKMSQLVSVASTAGGKTHSCVLTVAPAPRSSQATSLGSSRPLASPSSR